MSAYTPAPWVIAHGRCIYGSGDLVKPFVASIEDDHNDSETAANARLIVVAPDLLALLREVHDAVANGTADFSPSGDWFREASRVISKATGEAL